MGEVILAAVENLLLCIAIGECVKMFLMFLECNECIGRYRSWV